MNINAIYTGDIYPPISCQNVKVKERNLKMYFSFPKELRDNLEDTDLSFSYTDEMFCDLVIPGYSYETLVKVIEEAKKEIALKFIERRDGIYFNGDKYGVYFLDSRSRTTDIKESPQLRLEVFKTDYFTRQVLTCALKKLNISKDIFNTDSLNNELKWIRASFGVNVIVILNSVNQIILTKRSKHSSYSSDKSWYYVSVTEGFSESDIDEYSCAPSLTLCVTRGMEEELGIEKSMFFDSDIKFHDCFFETVFLQDGIVVSVALNENIFPDDIMSLRAKDKFLEIDEIFFIDNNRKAIKDFIDFHKDEMRSQTIFSLESYMSSL